MGATAAIGAMGVASAGNSYATSQAQKAQGEYQQSIYNINARYADLDAEDSIARGEFAADEVARKATRDVSKVRETARGITGAQKVGLAAQGIDQNSGSARDVTDTTKALADQDENDIKRSAALDAITIKNNAWREAWGYKAQARGYVNQGNFARIAGDMASTNTLITGGLNTVGYGLTAWGQYTKNHSVGSK